MRRPSSGCWNKAADFSDDVAAVIAIMPGRSPAIAQLLLDPAAPASQNFVLGAQLSRTREPDGPGPRGRATPAD
jgi:hypothetical protein